MENVLTKGDLFDFSEWTLFPFLYDETRIGAFELNIPNPIIWLNMLILQIDGQIPSGSWQKVKISG